MKVGVVGVGAVGSAITLGLLGRGVARDVVLVELVSARARAVALDVSYGTPLPAPVGLRAGGYDDLAEADLVIVTAGVNEEAGGATDGADSARRLRLLDTNAGVYRQVIPAVVVPVPQATIMVVTDPPDPLADLARVLAGHDRLFSTGIVLDSLRFRVHLGEHLGVCPADVRPWSSASTAPPRSCCRPRPASQACPLWRSWLPGTCRWSGSRSEIEDEIHYADINIIEGVGASQYGIDVVVARLAEAVSARRSEDLHCRRLPLR